ncbi:hypothetical protein C8J57DRAFT_1713096 [Mycena rebaudengoi]|nr:hypothetical protein C8J57DRAFT_1713096 [Mycena rebaudengoi]
MAGNPLSRSSSGTFFAGATSPALPASPFLTPPQPQLGDFGFDHSNAQGLGMDFSDHRPVQSTPDVSQLLTKLSTHLGLDDERRQYAHEFNTLSVDATAKLSILYINDLHLAHQTSAMRVDIKSLESKIDDILKCVKVAWSLSTAQQDALKKLLGSYLLRPVLTYKKLVDPAMAYVGSHRSKFHLQHFSTDEIIKSTIKLFLTSKVNETKSGYRKQLFKNVHLTLDILTNVMIDEYHIAPSSLKDADKIQIRAVLALQRKVALPLAARKNAEGEDTGFWTGLERELKELMGKHGTDRSAAGWVQWESEIIAADVALHRDNETNDVVSEGEQDEERTEE